MGQLEIYMITWMRVVWGQLRSLSKGEDGYTTQVVIMTALLAALALAVGAIITAKVLTKANNIDLNGSSGS